MYLSLLIILVTLYYAYTKPIYAIVLILNINLIRALVELNWSRYSFLGSNEPNFLLSVLLPLASYALMLLKIKVLKKKVLYQYDDTDFFFFISIIVMLIYCFVSPNFLKSFQYFIQYLLIGLPFYYMIKILLINYNYNIDIILKDFSRISIFLALVLGSLALFLAYRVDFIEIAYMVPIQRVTIPGVHAIPYTQTIGLGVLLLFSIIYTRGKMFGLADKNILFSLIGFLYLLFLVLIANTRGVLFSLVIAMLFYIHLYPIKISKKTARIFLIGSLLGVGFAFYFIDLESLFERLLNTFNNDKSATARIGLLENAFHIVLTNPIGVGTYGFIDGYPHNIFLDYIVSFGVFGWGLSAMLVFIIAKFYVITYNKRKEHPLLALIYCLIIYFFIETLISFTLWMHKGLYLSIGLFVAYTYLIKKQKSKNLNELKHGV